MKYLNVSLIGLSGRRHPSLSGATTTEEVKKMRPHLKMLVCDYLTYEVRAQHSGGSPICRLCRLNCESISHVLTSCFKLSETRSRILREFSSLCSVTKSQIDFEYISSDKEILSQFLIDPCSFNLTQRVHIDDPAVDQFYRLSRDLCFALDKDRRSQLSALAKENM